LRPIRWDSGSARRRSDVLHAAIETQLDAGNVQDRGHMDDDPDAAPCKARSLQRGEAKSGRGHKALADALKRLDSNGLVTHTVFPTALIAVEHAITPLSHSPRQVFEALSSRAPAQHRAIENRGRAYDEARAEA
jgi:hypothetical protein